MTEFLFVNMGNINISPLFHVTALMIKIKFRYKIMKNNSIANLKSKYRKSKNITIFKRNYIVLIQSK